LWKCKFLHVGEGDGVILTIRVVSKLRVFRPRTLASRLARAPDFCFGKPPTGRCTLDDEYSCRQLGHFGRQPAGRDRRAAGQAGYLSNST